MIRSKELTVTKQNLIKILQESTIKTFTILDPIETERQVLDAIRRNKGKLTTVIIAETQ